MESASGKSAETFDSALICLDDRFRRWHAVYPFVAAIVILPAAIEPESGTVILSRTMGIENFSLAEHLAERLRDCVPDLPVVVENNARMAAWGEKNGGSCIGRQNFITLHLTEGRRNGKNIPIGVGSGIVLNGRLYCGSNGGAGELDESCYRWFDKIYSNDRFPISLRELDPKSRQRFASLLGDSFSHLANYLAPEALSVVFDQEPAMPDFLEALQRALRSQLLIRHKNSFPMEICPDGVGAIIRGAAALVREKYFDDSASFLALLRERLQPGGDNLPTGKEK